MQTPVNITHFLTIKEKQDPKILELLHQLALSPKHTVNVFQQSSMTLISAAGNLRSAHLSQNLGPKNVSMHWVTQLQ